MFGASMRECQVDGRWNGSVPVCGPPTTVINVQQSSTESTKLSAEKAVDKDYSTCSSTAWKKDSYWFALLPHESEIAAVRVTFPASQIINAEVLVKSKNNLPTSCGRVDRFVDIFSSEVFHCPEHTYGHIIQLKDNKGTENFFRLCEVEVFIFTNLRCLLPDISKHSYGQRIESAQKFSYRYFCFQGYEMNGSGKTFCHPNGTWYPPAPVCEEVKCTVPPNIQNGLVVYDAPTGFLKFNGSVKYFCNDGYELEGNAVRFCIKNKVLSGTEPVCIRNQTEQSLSTEKSGLKCEHLESIPYTNAFFSNESRVHVSCPEGFTLKSTDIIICEADSGWNITDDMCEEITCSPQQMKAEGGLWLYSHMNGNKISIGTRMVLHCFDGYTLQGGPLNITCLPSGFWSTSTAMCEKHVVEAPAMQSTPNTNTIIIVAALLLGIALAVIILRFAEFLYNRRKVKREKRVGSLFHTHPDAIPDCSDNQNSSCADTFNSDEQYNSSLYEEVPESPRVVSMRTPSSELPLVPGYIHPFQNCETEDLDALHIYAEPITSCTMSKTQFQRYKQLDFLEGHVHSYSSGGSSKWSEENNVSKSEFGSSVSSDMYAVNDFYSASCCCAKMELSFLEESVCDGKCANIIDNDLYSSESEDSLVL